MSVAKVMLKDVWDIVKGIGNYVIPIVIMLGIMLFLIAFPLVGMVLLAFIVVLVFGAAIYGWVENAKDRERGLTKE